MSASLWCSAGFLVVLSYTAPSAAASFDCSKAQSRVEKTICAHAELSELDEYLGRYYFAARSTLREAAACLAADQRQWLGPVRNACADAACLKKVYLERLSALHPLQPGVTALRSMELPPVPALVWIIPPAGDRVAAPPNPAAKPLVAKGRVVDDIAQGDGYVLRTAEGASHLLLLLMFIDGPTGNLLAALSKEPNATFLAHGHGAVDPRGQTYYEPSRCVFLYRLP